MKFIFKIWILIILFILLICSIIFFPIRQTEVSKTNFIASSSFFSNYPQGSVIIEETGQRISVAIADTTQHRVQGLSDAPAIPIGMGMLFLFEKEEQHPFWMKDMKYAIDIIWLDKNSRIIYIERELKLDTYPKSFDAPLPSLYVLEMKAGESNKLNINIGDYLSIIR